MAINYLMNELLKDIPLRQTVTYVLNPSFCGACTEAVIEFINSSRNTNYDITIIYPLEDAYILESLDTTFSHYIPADKEELQRHGLIEASSRVFVIEHKTVLYDKKLSTHSLHEVAEDFRVRCWEHGECKGDISISKTKR